MKNAVSSVNFHASARSQNKFFKEFGLFKEFRQVIRFSVFVCSIIGEVDIYILVFESTTQKYGACLSKTFDSIF